MDDGSCTFDLVDIQGCTNPDALNYNADATVDDGSCTYSTDPPIQDPESTDSTPEYKSTSAIVGYCVAGLLVIYVVYRMVPKSIAIDLQSFRVGKLAF